MSFYQNTKEQRQKIVEKIKADILADLQKGNKKNILHFFADDDTYIRKAAYQAIGKIYFSKKDLQPTILQLLEQLLENDNEKIRQTTINAAGEIGKTDFSSIEKLMRDGLFDAHHIVRNAVIGSIKKIGEKNPVPTLAFAEEFLHHPDKEIRREICHGIELRGRTHPQDILPLLQQLENDKTARVKNTLIHVLGQISYKKGCLAIVVAHLKTWKNIELVQKALEEIIDVHYRYKDFAVLTQDEAREYIENEF